MKRIIIIIFLVFLILSLNVCVRIFNLSKILQNRFFALIIREFASKNVSRIWGQIYKYDAWFAEDVE